MEQLQSDEDNLKAAVDIAIDFSKLNSIAPEILLDYCLNFGSNGAYAPAYVFAKAAASLSEGKTKAGACYNAGLTSYYMGRNEDAEVQYKMALGLDPDDVNTHSNYGILLYNIGRNEDAEVQYKMALGLDSNYANAHGAYGFLLFDIGDDKRALAEIKTASRIFKEKDDNVMEHLVLAWLYERYAERYYKKGNAQKEKKGRTGGHFRKSGKYAKLAGDEYIMANKYVGDEGKGLYLSQGYTLKGRSEIRRLEFSFRDEIGLRMRNLQRDDYDKAKFEKIMDGVKNAACYYEKAAKHSPKRNAQCDACSNCMSALGSMLDYMLSIIHQRAVLELSKKINEWNEKLSYAEMGVQKNEKSEKFTEALRKFISCIDNLEKYKNLTRHEHKKALKDCMSELEEVASNIEGPLQEIIGSSTHQMKICMRKHGLYTAGAETEPKKDGVVSKIWDKVLDKIYDKIAIAIVAVLIFIISNIVWANL